MPSAEETLGDARASAIDSGPIRHCQCLVFSDNVTSKSSKPLRGRCSWGNHEGEVARRQIDALESRHNEREMDWVDSLRLQCWRHITLVW